MATERDSVPSSLRDWRSRTDELLPPEGDKALGYACFELLDEIIEDKIQLGLHSAWKRFYKLRRNKHFKIEKTGKGPGGLVSVNMLGTIHERTVNLLTDNNPTFNVVKAGQVTEEMGLDTILHAVEWWWGEHEQQQCLEDSVGDGELYGVTVEHVAFNWRLNFGLGEVETIVVDPHYFGLYPVRCTEAQKAEACLYFYPMSTREAKRRWPKFADKIVADQEYIKELGDDRREIQAGKSMQGEGWRSRLSGIVKNILNIAGKTEATQTDEVLILEVWCKDYTLITVEGEQVPKYTGHIRRVRTCNCGEIVLDDVSNPSINPSLPPELTKKTYLFDHYPFTKTESVKDRVTGWGMPLYEQLESLNVEMDKALSQFNMCKDAATRLKLLNPINSGVPNEHFTNIPGIVNPVDHIVAQGIRYLDPPTLSPDLLKAIDMYKDFFHMVAGAFELDQMPGENRVIAYKAIAALLERASTMLRGKIRNYSKLIRERGRMYISHAQNWYTQERWISYEDDGEEISEPIDSQRLMLPANLRVVSGSTMPVSQVQRREEAIELFKAQALPLDEFLKALQWPNAKQVVKKMQMGPIGQFLQKLQGIQVPPEILQLFQEIATMDDKDFVKKLEKGQIPSFMQILEALMRSPKEQPPQDPVQTAEIQEKMANVQKAQAEAALTKEKIATERVEQWVKTQGVGLDVEKLKIERAKIVTEIDKQLAEEKFMSKGGGQGPYREKGMTSNNA